MASCCPTLNIAAHPFKPFVKSTKIMKNLFVFGFIALAGCTTFVKSTVVFDNGLSSYQSLNAIGANPFLDGVRKRCPLCDSSVYPYCSDKLFHDSCCCHNANNPYDRLPYECQYADCSFLHSNSCYEHKLISACCCTNYLRK